MTGKVKIILLVLIFALVSGAVSFATVVHMAGKGNKIFPGVTVKGMDLGGFPKNKAQQLVQEYVDKNRKKNIVVRFDGQQESFSLGAIDYNADVQAITDKAYNLGRQGNFIEQWMARRSLAAKGQEIPYQPKISKEKFMAIIKKMASRAVVAPKDAKIYVDQAGQVQITNSVTGRGFDYSDAYVQLKDIIDNKLDGTDKLELSLATETIQPKYTTEFMRGLNVNGPVASFTTFFDGSKVNRAYNIKVAAAALDNKLVLPGESFSFNKVVGPRSSAAGYKDAKTIINNEFVDSPGGGVCQVSTTLYNSLLQQDVKITERSNHSLTIGYIPLGQDAAVAYGGKDLKFVNNLKNGLIIKSHVTGSSVTFTLYGDVNNRKTIRVVNNIVKKYTFKTVYKEDPTLPKGRVMVKQHGETGYRIASVLYVYQGGKLISQRNLSTSYYKPLDEIVLVGSGPHKVGQSKPNTGIRANVNKPTPSKPVTAQASSAQ